MKKIILYCGLAFLTLLGVVAGGDLMHYLSSRHSSKEGLFAVFAQDTATRKGFRGIYELKSESGGEKPGKDARIILNFRAAGVVTLRATRPGESLTDVGTFSASDGKITLELPGLEKKVEMQPYSLDGTKLVLPLQIIGDEVGSSTWQRIDTKPDVLRDAIDDFYTSVQKLGCAAALQKMVATLKKSSDVQEAKVCGKNTVRVTYKGGYQEFFLAPEFSGRVDRKSGPIASFSEPSMKESQTKRSLLSYIMPAIVESAHAQPMPMGGLGGPVMPIPGGGTFSEYAWLANEPEPVSHGDAPPVRKALILSAFHTVPLRSLTGPSYLFYTMQSKGEDLKGIVAALKHANYNVEGQPITDQCVTVKLLIEQLSGKSWGVFFFSTHGGIDEDDQLLSTGEEIPESVCMSPKDREKYLEKYLDNFKLFNLTNDQFKRLSNQIDFGFVHDGEIPFVLVKSGFFAAINADFSHTLVYLSACDTSDLPNFRNAMQPRAFLGWEGIVAESMNADMSLAFFRCLSRRTRSDREAWDFGVKYCQWKRDHNTKLNQEDKSSPTMDPHNFKLYRWGKSEPEKELSSQVCILLKFVRGWVCTYKGGKGLDETVHSLYLCSKKGINITNADFCKGAFDGQNIPDKELDIVKDESCGYQGGQPRFTLDEQSKL